MANPNDKYEKGNSNVEQNDDARTDCPCKGQNPLWPGQAAKPGPSPNPMLPEVSEKTVIPVVR